MQVDSRLQDVDDCLYRVAVRALIVQNSKVLLVQENSRVWWAFPGGGVDYGEAVEQTLTREIEEELGVPAKEVSSDFRVAYYNIGHVVNGIPRMNLFFRASLPEGLLQKTNHVATWGWFTKNEFLTLDLHKSFDQLKLVDIIFDD